jgi:hypothetical protein
MQKYRGFILNIYIYKEREMCKLIGRGHALASVLKGVILPLTGNGYYIGLRLINEII